MTLAIRLNKAKCGTGKINMKNKRFYFPYPLYPTSKVNIPCCTCSTWTLTKIKNNVFEPYLKGHSKNIFEIGKLARVVCLVYRTMR